MSVSDHEKESDVSSLMRNDNGSLIEASDIITRYYYTPQMDLASNMDDTNDSYESINALNKCNNKKKRIDLNKNDINDDVDDSETETELFCATNFLETEILVEENEVLIKSPSHMSHVTYGIPYIKKLNFEDQLIKKRTRISKNQESGKIICEMYGVRTINYNLPEPDLKPNEVGIKSSRLSESDSDSQLSSSSRSLKTIRLPETEWRDLEKNLHQPLLSDSNSSPSSRSDTNSSSTSSSTSSTSSCSTCSSCNKLI